MEIQSGFIKYKDNDIHILKMGSGKKLMIAVHGFGNEAGIFQPVAAAFSEEYTVVSIDVPGHGATKWNKRYFDKEDLMAVIQGIKIEFGTTTFTLMGFSLGGRICQNVLVLQPDWIEQLILLAPDGLEKNFWYNAATRSPLGKIIFKKILKKPEGFIKYFDRLGKWKLIDASSLKFAKANLTNENIRHQLSYVWPVTSLLITNRSLVKWTIKKYNIPVHLYMGKHDRIFPPAQGERFVKGLKTAHLHILNEGHNLINDTLIQELKAVL